MKKHILCSVFGIFVFAFLAFFSSCKKEEKTNLPTEGMVAYYLFNGNAQDASSNAANGQLSGAPQTVSDRKGRANSAIQFDGKDDFITIPFGLNFAADFSIAFWMKYDNHVGSSNAQVLFAKGEGCPDGNPNYEGTSYMFGIGAEYLGCKESGEEDHLNGRAVETGGNFFDDRIVATTQVAEIAPDEWFFIVWSYNAATKRFSLSVNGKSLDDSELPHFYERGGTANCTPIAPSNFGQLHQTNSSLTIGALESYCGHIFRYDNFFKGTLDDVRFYNRQLDASEIQALFVEE